MTRKVNILITGGAGFIGSNLVEHFLKDSRVGLVRVLDNLSNGYFENIQEFLEHDNFEFIQGDIRDYATCLSACEGIDKISHQAALGSVPRSIEDPMLSTAANVLGTVNVLHAAVQQKVERMVLACSSSTYGDHPDLPKLEENIGQPLSPYAVTKAAIEQFADVFEKTYGLTWIGLRYFNVFGYKQSEQGAYAAVIPKFIGRALRGETIEIYGDGKTCRDFTHIHNVIHANDLALFEPRLEKLNTVFNVGCGETHSLNSLITHIETHLGKSLDVTYSDFRTGDIKESLASIQKISEVLGYQVQTTFSEGIQITVEQHHLNLLP